MNTARLGLIYYAWQKPAVVGYSTRLQCIFFGHAAIRPQRSGVQILVPVACWYVLCIFRDLCLGQAQMPMLS